jgi:hypothetical protein
VFCTDFLQDKPLFKKSIISISSACRVGDILDRYEPKVYHPTSIYVEPKFCLDMFTYLGYVIRRTDTISRITYSLRSL